MGTSQKHILVVTQILLLSALISCSEAEEVRSSRFEHPTVEQEPEVSRSSERDTSSPVATNVEEYQQAADLVREYYTAISRGSDRRAYDLWEEGRLTFEEFIADAEMIDRAVVTFETSGRAGMSEGMPMIQIPVTVAITTIADSTEERHEIFLLRKSSDQNWRIFDRKID